MSKKNLIILEIEIHALISMIIRQFFFVHSKQKSYAIKLRKWQARRVDIKKLITIIFKQKKIEKITNNTTH